jgi:hypothetical protein
LATLADAMTDTSWENTKRYKDFRNKMLEVSTCYKWTIDGIQGKDDKAREIYLESIRRLYAEKQ